VNSAIFASGVNIRGITSRIGLEFGDMHDLSITAMSRSNFGDAPTNELVTRTTLENGHRRIETRSCTASGNVDWIVSDRHYPGETATQHVSELLMNRDRDNLARMTICHAGSRPIRLATSLV
jgi:hypothetical protein